MDNGSVKPAATLQLRWLAQQLSALAQAEVEAVSLRHADRIAASQLDSTPAQTLLPYLSRKLQQGEKSFSVIPLFFANSGALTEYLPSKIADLKKQFGDFEFRLADVLYPLPDGEPQLLGLLQDQLQTLLNRAGRSVQVILVDHGSPDPQVTAVRNQLAQRLQQKMTLQQKIEEAVMERREGSEYDFNGELLANVLQRKAQQGVSEIILLMQFFLPGRHAGEGGDIEQICQRIEQHFPATRITISPLVADSPLLIPLLHSRLQQLIAPSSGA